MVATKRISSETAQAAIRLLESVQARMPKLPDPQVALGPDMSVGLNWSGVRHFAGLDYYPDGTVEFFYEDLVNGELWSRQGFAMLDKFLEKLERIHETIHR